MLKAKLNVYVKLENDDRHPHHLRWNSLSLCICLAPSLVPFICAAFHRSREARKTNASLNFFSDLYKICRFLCYIFNYHHFNVNIYVCWYALLSIFVWIIIWIALVKITSEKNKQTLYLNAMNGKTHSWNEEKTKYRIEMNHLNWCALALRICSNLIYALGVFCCCCFRFISFSFSLVPFLKWHFHD